MTTFLLALTLPALPLGEPPVPEVATNVTLRTLPRHLASVAFQIDGGADGTREIALALGTDADADGALAIEETSRIFGCDCGGWYLADLDACTVTGLSTNALVLTRNAYDRDWNLLKIVQRGGGSWTPVVTAIPTLSPFIIRIR